MKVDRIGQKRPEDNENTFCGATKRSYMLAEMVAEPAMVERWVSLGLVSLGDPAPAEIAGFVAREAARWAPVVRASGA